MMNRSIENDIFFCLDRAPRVITSPWFIGLIVSAIVLIIVVAIVCGIMRRKGGKYSGKFLFHHTYLKTTSHPHYAQERIQVDRCSPFSSDQCMSSHRNRRNLFVCIFHTNIFSHS